MKKKNESYNFVFILISISSITILYNFYKWWPLTIDDAFITFRYAENLASGIGLKFNVGQQPPAEGYTSILWTLLMTLPHLLKINPVVFSKVVGSFCTILMLITGFKFITFICNSSEKSVRYTAGMMFVAMLSASEATAIHTLAGMETMLYTFLILLFYYLITRLLASPNNKTSILSIISGLLIGLTRPEGNLIVLVCFFTTLALIAKAQRKNLVCQILLIYILPSVLYFLWRMNYHEYLFPLSFYIKVAKPKLFSGLPAVSGFLGFTCLQFGAVILLGLPKIKREILPLIISCTGFIVFFTFPEHVMGYMWRFLFPIFPCLVLIASMGIGNLYEIFQSLLTIQIKRHNTIKMIFVGICLTIIVNIIAINVLINGLEANGLPKYADGLKKAHIYLGKKLFEIGNRMPGRVLAINDAGAVPYYSKWKTIDIIGLNSPEIAMMDKYDPKYPELVLDQNPDVIVLPSYAKDKFTIGKKKRQWKIFLYKSCLDRGYEKITDLEFSQYYLWILAKPEGQMAELLREL